MFKLLFVVPILLGQSANQQSFSKLKQPNAPIPFRCDSLHMDGKKYEMHCQGNVVVKYNDLLLCCDSFTAFADKEWNWQTAHCRHDIRAHMEGKWMWGNKADYEVKQKVLTITGAPLLKQGKSWFESTKLTAFVQTEVVKLQKPRGVLVQQQKELRYSPIRLPLPERCPIPKRIMTGSASGKNTQSTHRISTHKDTHTDAESRNNDAATEQAQ